MILGLCQNGVRFLLRNVGRPSKTLFGPEKRDASISSCKHTAIQRISGSFWSMWSSAVQIVRLLGPHGWLGWLAGLSEYDINIREGSRESIWYDQRAINGMYAKIALSSNIAMQRFPSGILERTLIISRLFLTTFIYRGIEIG